LEKLADVVAKDVSSSVAFLVLVNPLVALVVETVEVTEVSLAFRVVNKIVEEELLAIVVVENDVKPVLFVVSVVVELVVLLDDCDPVEEIDVDNLVVDLVTKLEHS